MSFADRFPNLFHVTDRAALDDIRAHGLLSARRLCAMHGVNGDVGTQLLHENRAGYRTLAPGAALRRQGMRDQALRPRLDPAITCAEWRWFINGMVFFFPRLASAKVLCCSEPDREQVVLCFATAALLEAAIVLYSCPFNNGFIDRAPIATARQRHYSDYARVNAPVDNRARSPVKEVVAEGCIPAQVEFAVLPAP